MCFCLHFLIHVDVFCWNTLDGWVLCYGVLLSKLIQKLWMYELDVMCAGLLLWWHNNLIRQVPSTQIRKKSPPLWCHRGIPQNVKFFDRQISKPYSTSLLLHHQLYLFANISTGFTLFIVYCFKKNIWLESCLQFCSWLLWNTLLWKLWSEELESWTEDIWLGVEGEWILLYCCS